MQTKVRRNPRTVAHYLSLTLALLLCFFNCGVHVIGTAPDDSAFLSASAKPLRLVPGGIPFGVKMETDGVLVVGFSKIGTKESPAEACGIMRGDVIKSLDGKSVTSCHTLVSLIEASQGKPLTVALVRNGKHLTKQLTARSDGGGVFRAGLKVKDGAAGIGTVTAIDPDTMTFLGLGHGICDSDTGVLMPLKSGRIYDVSVSSVQKGAQGAPGEIKGYFSSDETGVLLNNTPYGVTGKWNGKCLDHISPMEVASRSEIVTGKATVICTLSDNVRREYEIRLLKVTSPNGKDKNFVIEVIDEALLSESGGIVQGMSGSPIIQNGKIIGAVTHVMVGEPTKGYGIFIDNMLNAAVTPTVLAA